MIDYEKAKELIHGGAYPDKWTKTEKFAYQAEECNSGLDCDDDDYDYALQAEMDEYLLWYTEF